MPRARSIPTSSSGDEVAASAASRARVLPVPVPWPISEEPAPVITALTSAKSTLTWSFGVERWKRKKKERVSFSFVRRKRPREREIESPISKKKSRMQKLEKTNQPGDRDDVRNAAHALAEDVVGDAEGLGDGKRGVDGVEEAEKFFLIFSISKRGERVLERERPFFRSISLASFTARHLPLCSLSLSPSLMERRR